MVIVSLIDDQRFSRDPFYGQFDAQIIYTNEYDSKGQIINTHISWEGGSVAGLSFELVEDMIWEPPVLGALITGDRLALFDLTVEIMSVSGMHACYLVSKASSQEMGLGNRRFVARLPVHE